MQELKISHSVVLASHEWEIIPIRAQGCGGQNVNKVSSAVHLRFDIKQSTLPDFHKQCLLNLGDSRINKEGVLVLKAQQHRSFEKNRLDAVERLAQIIRNAIKKIRKEWQQNQPKVRLKGDLNKKRTKEPKKAYVEKLLFKQLVTTQ